MPLDRQRLTSLFIRLCETPSPSGREGPMAELAREIFSALGADEVIEDHSAALTGADCGNLVIRFQGDPDLVPLFVNCHLDTVEPGEGVRVELRDGVFQSAGDTILGADDKAGIAALAEALAVIREDALPLAPLDCVFTTCEEIGLLGARALDTSLIRARMGYTLDTTGMGRAVIGAPACTHLRVLVQGRAAHAGLAPEEGVSALLAAAEALAAMPHGRVAPGVTVNAGRMEAGRAVNIVPDRAAVDIEVRGHDPARLDLLVREIGELFIRAAEARGAVAEVETEEAFPLMKVDPETPVVRRLLAAARRTGLHMELERAEGGADANIFTSRGLPTVIVGTGMDQVHSTDERLRLDDLERLTRLLVALLAS